MASTKKIRLGIVGYGNLGRGVELAVKQNPDTELVAIFTRRDPGSIQGTQTSVVSIDDVSEYQDKIDVMILCGGSAKDLPKQTPPLATLFNTVDSFDNHNHIPEYFAAVDESAMLHGHLSLISTGWDPGLFSMARVLGESVIPEGDTYTFWGKGVSQGHSDAIRRVNGVKNGIQYTVPNEDALSKVRSGNRPELTTAQKHKRVCYIVAEPGADLAQIEQDIKTMPDYFEPYHTEVNFITEEELKKSHSAMPHGGIVMRSGVSGVGTVQHFEFGLNLGSNPEFTSSVLLAFARAVYRLSQEGRVGAVTVFDVPLAYLSSKSPEELRKHFL